MTLLWVTEYFVMRRLIETMKINVVIWKLRCKAIANWRIRSNDEIMQFSYFYRKTNEKKADDKMTLFHDGICHDCDIA